MSLVTLIPAHGRGRSQELKRLQKIRDLMAWTPTSEGEGAELSNWGPGGTWEGEEGDVSPPNPRLPSKVPGLGCCRGRHRDWPGSGVWAPLGGAGGVGVGPGSLLCLSPQPSCGDPSAAG